MRYTPVVIVVAVALFLVLVRFSPAGMPFIPGNPYSDAVTAHWSAATFTRASVLGGEYPLWRETIMAGAPFAANPLNKTTYPPQWLVLLLPAAWHLNTLILLHLFIAGAGMWAWARTLDLQPAPAALAVLAYVMAPRIAATLGAGHLDVIYALAWAPWLFWLLHQRVGVGWLLQVALIAALVFLADVRVSLFVFLFAGVYALWLRDMRRIAWAAGAVIPFTLLVAALIVPLLAWQPYLSRAGLTIEEAGGFSLDPFGLAGLLLPPHEGGGGFEVMVYLTLPVLVLALIGLFTRGEGLFWGGVILVVALWAMGLNTPFWRALAQFEPLRWFRVPGRAWLVVVWCAPVLAGYGLQALMHASDRWRTEDPPQYVFWLRLIAAGAAGVFAVCGATLLITGLVDLPQSAAALMIFNGLAIGAVLLVVLLRHGRAQVVAWSFIALTFADAAITGVNWLEWRTPDEWLLPYAPLAQALTADDAALVYSPSYALPQEAAQAHGLRLFYGVDPFQLRAFVEALEQASNVPVDGYSITLPPLTGVESDDDIPFANQGIPPDATALARWGVSHVIAAYSIAGDDFTLLDTVEGVNIYRNTQYDPATTPPDLLPAETVRRLHRLTLISVWVSAMAWVAVSAAIIYAHVGARPISPSTPTPQESLS